MKKSILWTAVLVVAFMGSSALWRNAVAQTDSTKPTGTRASTSGANDFSWPRRPFLAIDSKAHTGKAMHIALTPDDARAVTAAYDGTVRVWDVQTGDLLQRFSLPKSADNGALLRGLALSPDGQRVAVSGFNMRRAIMIMSLQTGQIERVIMPPENNVMLAWSPDGRYLAAGKSAWEAAGGVRVYQVDTGAEVFNDADYPKADVASLQFRADGALFASTWDGRGSIVKLYKPEGNSWRLVAQKTPRFGDFRNRWDVAGKTIFIGAHTRLSGESLEDVPHDFDRRGAPFSRVIQSPSGSHYFGTSWSFVDTHGYLRRWAGTRRIDGYEQIKLPDPRVADMAVTRKGEVLYVSDIGTVGMVARDFKLSWRVAHDVPKLDRHPDTLKVTESGLVSFPVSTAEGQREIVFNLASPEFVPVARVREKWKSPSTSGKGVVVMAWDGTQVGTINEARIPLKGNTERTLSVAVHSTDGTVAVGSSFERLYKVSAKGERIWDKYLGANVLAVNLIESRDLLVAATANGMLWVYRWSTGEVVMSYYLQPSSKRWLAISSQGYFEASVGAEDMAGWVINPKSQRVADFVPMSRFRAKLLLNGLGSQAWESRSESDALKILLSQRAAASPTVPMPVVPVIAPEASPAALVVEDAPATTTLSASAVSLEELPPQIEVISPGHQITTTSRQVSIRFKAITPSASPVTRVRTQVASSSVANRNLMVGATGSANAEREVVVDIPAEDTEIRLIAENQFGASVPVVIRVVYAGPKQQAAKGNLYLLAAGVSQYDNPAYTLGLAAKDARDFVTTLTAQKGALYGEVHVKQLLDKDASKASVEAGFEWLRANMTARDTAIVFFAGHGLNDGPTYYFMTREADLNRLPQTSVPFNKIRAVLTELPGRVMIFVDTCHSGNVMGKAMPRQARDATHAINDLASSENGLVVFASSTGGQFSQENPAWGNGAFTKAVVEGLEGAADFKKRGRVTYKGLDAYVSDRVDELTKGEQTPVTPVLQGVADFTIAQVKR
jgi:Caspase domain/WD domain, G-beta repeat